jgi:hypothetical protein
LDNNTRAFFVRLIEANPGATDERLRKAFLEQIRASPMGHIVNPRKLVDDEVDWDAWMANVRQVRKELESQAARHRPEAKILPCPRRKLTPRGSTLGKGK